MKLLIFDFYQTLYDPKRDRLYPGTFNMLKKLGNTSKLILITTTSPNRKKQIKIFNLAKIFNKTIICEQKRSSIFKKLIYKPQETFIIGDRKESEIRIGKNLKCNTIFVNSSKENPVLTISKFLKIYE